MPNVRIFQIHYSAQTRAQLDPGFAPLDNTANERPDWREYWPIRNHLLRDAPAADDYCGFLSPAFHAKTGLSSAAVFEFVAAQAGRPDVILFSPFFDQSAFFLNPWEQGTMTHPDSAPAFEQCLALVAPDFGIKRTVCSSRDTVFCNYFVARGRFWRAWLERCERLYECAERADTEFGRLASRDVTYRSGAAPFKVFAIERIASALLATQPHWITAAYNPMLLPYSESFISRLGVDLAALDALKLAYQAEPRRQYLQAFFGLRARWAAALQKA